MNNLFTKRWDENKNKLEQYYKTIKPIRYYSEIVKLVVENIINADSASEWDRYDVEKMVLIDDGDYQGTQIFIFPVGTYQPHNYIMLHCSYGSCSGCDTLMDINEYEYENLLTDEQVKDYMTLSLHLLQSAKIILE